MLTREMIEQEVQRAIDEQRKDVNFSGSWLLDDDLRTLISVLNEHAEITSLKLSHSALNRESIAFLSQLQYIQYLTLNNNDIGEGAAKLVTQMPHLVFLNLQHNGINPQTGVEILAAMSGSHLRYFFLDYGNQIDGQVTAAIESAVQSNKLRAEQTQVAIVDMKAAGSATGSSQQSSSPSAQSAPARLGRSSGSSSPSSSLPGSVSSNGSDMRRVNSDRESLPRVPMAVARSPIFVAEREVRRQAELAATVEAALAARSPSYHAASSQVRL